MHISCFQGAYFIGKAVWGKGYRELINLGADFEAARPEPLVLDVIGARWGEGETRVAMG